MRHKIIITTAVFCLLAGFSVTGRAQAASRTPDSASIMTQDFSYHLTAGKGRIKSSAKAVSVKFRQSKYKLKIGQKKKISVTIRPSIASEKPVFASENPMIAEFISGNLIYAKQPGYTYVTATLSNGRQARCKVVVKNRKNNFYKDKDKDNDKENPL